MPNPSEQLRKQRGAQLRRDVRHQREVRLLAENAWATVYFTNEAKRPKPRNTALALNLLVAGVIDNQQYDCAKR